MVTGLARLSAEQQQLVSAWLPGATLDEDHSWDLVETTVLRLAHDGSRVIVKAGDESDTHIAREIHAHRHWLVPWTSIGRASALLHFNVGAKILVTTYLPGRLVLGSENADDPGAFRQAGHLLALLHAQEARVDHDYESQANRKALAWLDGRHRIEPRTEARLRAEIASWPTPPATLVPTHGDWQPRNWLVLDGLVGVIDLGRAGLRPAMSDLTRLAAQDFRRVPGLESAFLDGYGPDPREASAWYRTRVREAIGTAAWAYRVGDETFEAQGHRMIAEVLADPGRD